MDYLQENRLKEIIQQMNRWVEFHRDQDPFETAFQFLRLSQTFCVFLVGVNCQKVKETIFVLTNDQVTLRVVDQRQKFDQVQEMIYDKNKGELNDENFLLFDGFPQNLEDFKQLSEK